MERSQVRHPEWSIDAVIYEINTRQFSQEGTFSAIINQLPHLKKLGVTILWIMPVHPIGKLKRKGTLGSYYSVKDYYAVNPEFGTLQEFKQLVDEVHQLDMHIIIDWVANHTSRDSDLAKEHPEWFKKDEHGNFVPPVKEWSDVIALDFRNQEVWRHMSNVMEYWVKETDIDGFRCDVAYMVPVEFWNQIREKLEQIKPVFLLAESAYPELQVKAFDMTYCWTLHEYMNKLVKKKSNAGSLKKFVEQEEKRYPSNAYRMLFTSNHDINTWEGSAQERLGDALEVCTVLTYTLPGMPLIYNGQEGGLKKSIRFFEKDPIEWQDSPMKSIYRSLNQLKQENQVLWNGENGGMIKRVKTNHNRSIFAFTRQMGNNKIFVITNLSNKRKNISFSGNSHWGDYTDWKTKESVSVAKRFKVSLDKWDYRILLTAHHSNLHPE